LETVTEMIFILFYFILLFNYFGFIYGIFSQFEINNSFSNFIIIFKGFYM